MGEREDLLRAIRRKCVYCCGGSVKEAARCRSEECPLWKYRPAFAQRQKKRKGAVQITMRMLFETKGGIR